VERADLLCKLLELYHNPDVRPDADDTQFVVSAREGSSSLLDVPSSHRIGATRNVYSLIPFRTDTRISRPPTIPAAFTDDPCLIRSPCTKRGSVLLPS
jgi:hypothetical protein